MIDIQIQKELRGALGVINMQLDLTIAKGQFVSLYGKSGAGKTSLLRIIAGLLPPDQGTITVDHTPWVHTATGLHLPVQQRNVGVVFQEYSLFPNMTVRGNIEFALHKHQHPKIISELLELMELGDLQHQRPQQLSGGQQQRVALARALVQHPKILLLDEPLSALDTEMRTTLQQYIRSVHQEYQLTTVLVSHDIPEILKLSDYVYHIDKGKCIHQGTPIALFASATTNNTSPVLMGEIISIHNTTETTTLTVLLGTTIITVARKYTTAYTIGASLQITAKDLE